MSRRFAADTSVPMDRSIAEIRTTVRRYGATEFAHMESDAQAAITFTMRGRRVLFRLAMPDRHSSEFTRTETGKARSATAAETAWEQACRSRWRTLALVIKAKLEAVEVGIVVFEQEFLGHIVVPGDGRTVGEMMGDKLEFAYSGNSASLLSYFEK